MTQKAEIFVRCALDTVDFVKNMKQRTKRDRENKELRQRKLVLYVNSLQNDIES